MGPAWTTLTKRKRKILIEGNRVETAKTKILIFISQISSAEIARKTFYRPNDVKIQNFLFGKGLLKEVFYISHDIFKKKFRLILGL
jgi:hypothetical protein